MAATVHATMVAWRHVRRRRGLRESAVPTRGTEALHPSFALSQWLVGILCPVILPATRVVSPHKPKFAQRRVRAVPTQARSSAIALACGIATKPVMRATTSLLDLELFELRALLDLGDQPIRFTTATGPRLRAIIRVGVLRDAGLAFAASLGLMRCHNLEGGQLFDADWTGGQAHVSRTR